MLWEEIAKQAAEMARLRAVASEFVAWCNADGDVHSPYYTKYFCALERALAAPPAAENVVAAARALHANIVDADNDDPDEYWALVSDLGIALAPPAQAEEE